MRFGRNRKKRLREDYREQRWFFLARSVFHCTVGELKQRLTEREFIQWHAYYKLEPWGDDWYQTASLMALYANSKSKKGTTYDADEFIPFRDVEDTGRHKRRKEAIRAFNKMRANEKKK